MTKPDIPKIGELVVCEITKINPNSAYARLIEYDKMGMIHVSEVAKRWVRDIREFVKEGSLVVCRVTRNEGGSLSLSIKRVDKDQSDRKLQEYKRERNTEKLLEQVGKQFGKSLEQTYTEVGYTLQEEFGSLFKAFEIALKDPELLVSKGADKKWADAIIEIAAKSFVKKTYELKADLVLISYAPNGIELVKERLDAISKGGLDVKYLAAAKYQIGGVGDNAKELNLRMEKACQEAVDAIEAAGGEGSFTIAESK